MSTSTPLDARAHARAMAGSLVESMPTIPAADATDLPSGIDLTALVWAETVGAGGYASRVLHRGSVLRLTDLKGDACVNLLVYNANNPIERLNVADTVKVQWNAYPGQGSLLLSDMGRVLMSMVEDTSGRHDTFGGCSNQRTNTARYGQGANHSPFPNGRDRLLLALAKHGLGRRDLMPNINLFRAVRIAEDGSMIFDPDPSGPGAYLELRAEMDVLVVLANTPHVLDERPEYSVTPVRLLAWRGAPTPAGDPIREATPEGLRAFQNTEDYLA
jgi:uncharacterized protein